MQYSYEVLLTVGWKTACISQDIPAAKRPGGLKLKHKDKGCKNICIVVDVQ